MASIRAPFHESMMGSLHIAAHVDSAHCFTTHSSCSQHIEYSIVAHRHTTIISTSTSACTVLTECVLYYWAVWMQCAAPEGSREANSADRRDEKLRRRDEPPHTNTDYRTQTKTHNHGATSLIPQHRGVHVADLYFVRCSIGHTLP